MKKKDASDAHVFLVNTGWAGGAHGQGGQYFTIPTTRMIIRAIQEGALNDVETIHLPGLNIDIPVEVSGIDPSILQQRKTWDDSHAYDGLDTIT